MNKLLDEEYYNLGTDKIYKELWLYPQMEQTCNSYIKPYGGLWTSHQNNYSLSDWIDYKEETIDDPEIINFYYSLKSCLIKFKENTKLVCINSENDYKNLKDSGFVKKLDKPIELSYYNKYTINELIDYEKLSDYYSLLYINPISNEILSNYSIKTMYALKPESIEYYKTIDVDFNTHTIKKVYDKEFIKEPNKDYYDFVNYIRKIYRDNNKKEYNEYIKELYNEQKRIIKYLINKKTISFSIEGIDNIHLIKTIVKNIYRERYLEKQKSLIKK